MKKMEVAVQFRPSPMSLFSWNCKGLENSRTVNALKEVIKIEKPKIVFLMETKSSRDWMVKI